MFVIDSSNVKYLKEASIYFDSISRFMSKPTLVLMTKKDKSEMSQ